MLLAHALAWALVGSACTSRSPPAVPPNADVPTRGFPAAPDVHDSVYLPVDRSARPPGGYGLYTVLLSRAADRSTVRVLADLFTTTVSAREAALPREHLNLITLPVKSVSEATRTLAAARSQPEATAAAVMQKSYDYGQAALWLASVCRADRGADVMKVCGSTSPDGPLLVTSQRPLDGAGALAQPLLIVNLANTPPEAVREVMAAYRRQLQRGNDFDDRKELDAWRLKALNAVLDAARFLPLISKAYAGIK
jgi:hypothetical protein